jgi:hypothetical protein
MKHLRRIFENKFIFRNEEIKRYIEECFLDISENPNFEVDDLIEVDRPEQTSDITTSKLVHMYIYRVHIELGKNLSLPRPVLSNMYIGMVETNLEFLKMKNEKLLELYNDIEVAVERIKDKFDYKCDVEIRSNKREEIDITILVAKN